MKNMINPTVLMAIATFLWYRKGRLWFFYDTLVSKCTVQITKDSIDREKWEEIALQQCEQLAHETFQSLFRFEVEYLQEHIANHKYEFWIGDSEANTDYSIKYTDKTTFCKFRIRELFHSLFEFCGLRLFVKETRNKSLLDLSALVTAKRGFPLAYKISDLHSQILAVHPCTG